MNLMARTEKADAQYQVYEEPFGFDERGPFRKVDSTGNAKGGRHVESLVYPVTNPFTGEQVYPRKGRCWVYRRATLARIREGMAGFAGPLTVYGERTALSEASLRTQGITFKQTPYDVRARK